MRSSKAQRWYSAFPLLLCVAVPSLAGCTGGHALVRRDTDGLDSFAWFSPALPSDQAALERWATGVGPAVFREAPATAGSGSNTLIVVSWNTALGKGNLDALVNHLRQRHGDAPFVLLLQEVYRSGPEVPFALTTTTAVASRLGGSGIERAQNEIEAIAARLVLHLYYVPSMRNGPPQASDEDRGNAILSTLPLRDLAAIELPFERQRRVAVAASIDGVSADGTGWTLRVASAHLDNMVGVRRLWFAGGEFARTRQVRALSNCLSDHPSAVLGGDFNTWFGFSDRAYAELAPAFPDTNVEDRRATFRSLLRLDHLFFRLPDGWHAQFQRGDDRYGSDHFPLIGSITIASRAPGTGRSFRAGSI